MAVRPSQELTELLATCFSQQEFEHFLTRTYGDELTRVLPPPSTSSMSEFLRAAIIAMSRRGYSADLLREALIAMRPHLDRRMLFRALPPEQSAEDKISSRIVLTIQLDKSDLSVSDLSQIMQRLQDVLGEGALVRLEKVEEG